MKKIVFILMLLTSKIVAQQTANDCPVDSIYGYSENMNVAGSKTLYSYDANNNPIRIEYKYWDGKMLKTNNIDSNYYDSNNNKIIYLRYYPANGGITRTLYTYDNNNNPATVLTQYWDNNNWVNNYNDIYLYSIENNLIEHTPQYWTNNEWENNYKYFYTYNSSNNQLTKSTQHWENNTWVNYSLALFNYDVNNNLTLIDEQGWNENLNSFLSGMKTLYTYNSENQNLEKILQMLEGTEFVNYYRNSYSYDINGNIINDIRYQWDGTTWLLMNQYSYTFDTNHNMTELLYEEWIDSVWVSTCGKYNYSYNGYNDMLVYTRSHLTNGSWITSDSVQYYYCAASGIDDSENGSDLFTLYPNPAKDYLTVSLSIGEGQKQNSKISIVNSIGQVVFSSTPDSYRDDIQHSTFDISQLPTGLYHLLLEDKQGRVQAKNFVVAR